MMYSLHGVLVSSGTVVLAEIGDKTLVATVPLAARYEPQRQGIVGTALGMLIANLPVVWMGHKFADRLPLKLARNVASAVFLALAIWVAWFGIGWLPATVCLAATRPLH